MNLNWEWEIIIDQSEYFHRLINKLNVEYGKMKKKKEAEPNQSTEVKRYRLWVNEVFFLSLSSFFLI